MAVREAASTNPMQPLHLPVCIFFAAFCGSEGVLHQLPEGGSLFIQDPKTG